MMIGSADGADGGMLVDYVGGVSVIHLPGRKDRYALLERELSAVHLPLTHPKVTIPHAPVVDDADGFPSRGVRGNFLSHLSILREARDRDYEAVMVLEDDAIFRRVLRRPAVQHGIVDVLRHTAWGLCFLGHPLLAELTGLPKGLIPYAGHFRLTHCYLVHRSALGSVIAYFEETMVNPPGSARGGRMYIDAAFSHYRGLHPDVVTLVANPSLSAQRGSPSSLGDRRSYDAVPFVAALAARARGVRDEMWRRSLRSF